MKITEVSRPRDRAALTESLSANNNTGFLSEDLVQIVEAHEGEWSAEMSADDMLAEMDAMEKEWDERNGTTE